MGKVIRSWALNTLVHYVNFVFSGFNPELDPNPTCFGPVSLLGYKKDEEKQEAIDELIRRLPNNFPVLTDIKTNQDTWKKTYPPNDYLRTHYMLSSNGDRREVNPVMINSFYQEFYDIAQLKGELADFATHPIIQAMVGLQEDQEYQRNLAQGKFPYILVDANVDCSFDWNEWQEAIKNEDAEKYNDFFHYANTHWHDTIGRLILYQNLPVILLASKEEVVGLTKLGEFPQKFASFSVL
jgi:hypothetical protein